MEYAIRAGALTSRYYGEAEELLGKYAWFFPDSGERSWPVGSKKPNDFGLFDMHGNVNCWCQDSWQEYPKGASGDIFEDKQQHFHIDDQESRILRCGSFDRKASDVRSATRYISVPTDREFDVGFRVARTLALPAQKDQ
jgi:formylglycine-generating enzyme required for sulfatase activity